MFAQDDLHHFRGADFAEPVTRRAAARWATSIHPRAEAGRRRAVEYHVARALAGVAIRSGNAWLVPAVSEVDQYRLSKQGGNVGVGFLAHDLFPSERVVAATAVTHAIDGVWAVVVFLVKIASALRVVLRLLARHAVDATGLQLRA